MSINKLIENCFNDEGKNSLINFYQELQKTTFYYIDRYQSKKINSKINYPSDNFPALLIEDSNKIVLPIFSSIKDLNLWTDSQFSYKEISFDNLANITKDEDIWLIINAGSDFYKELSPWEVSKVKAGDIDEIIEDILVREIEDTEKLLYQIELPKIESKLNNIFKKNKKINLAWIITDQETNYLGVKVQDLDITIKELENIILKEIETDLIGGSPFKIIIEDPSFKLALGMFEQFAPFYTK